MTKYKLEIDVKEVIGFNNPLVTATLSHGEETPVTTAWLNIPLKEDNLGELFGKVIQEMFPTKSAPDNPEEESKKPLPSTKRKTK